MIARIEQPTVRTWTCEVPGCKAPTREGKPVCSVHVERQPYVRALLEAIATHEREVERVRARGPRAVDPRGLMAREILLHLHLHGARTPERLARELQLDGPALEGYLAALTGRGVVERVASRRGGVLVQLAGR